MVHSPLPYCEGAMFLSNEPLSPQLMGEQQVREVNYDLVLYYTIGQLPEDPLGGKASPASRSVPSWDASAACSQLEHSPLWHGPV